MSSEDSDIEDKLIDLEIDENRVDKQFLNVLLLGETGVGKSTFINAVANYITYKYFDVAEKNKLCILVPSKFTVQDKGNVDRTVLVGEELNHNECLETGMSATSGIRKYLFPVWDGKLTIRLIDTPGMGDTGGIQQDDINCNKVLDYVSKLDHLHAICFLFRPTESRRTMFFEYCLLQILSRLDKTACNRLFFLFTKTRGANYGASETVGVLKELMSELNKYSDVNIPFLPDKNIFCFDNEGFRCLAALQENVELSESVIRNSKQSWKTSAQNWWKLFNSIRTSNQIPYTPNNIMMITRARKNINTFSKALMSITKRLNENNDVLRRLCHNRDADLKELEELKVKQNLIATVVDKEHTSIPRLVCSASSCMETYKVNNETKAHYKTICHQDCEEVSYIEKEVVGHPQIVNCFHVDKLTGQCLLCRCDFSVHMWIDYKTVLKDGYVLDENVTKQMAEKENLLRSALDIISDIQRKNMELTQEREIVKDFFAKLATFTRQNAIVPYNHRYGEYVKQCIRNEQSNVNANKSHLDALEKLQEEYEELSKIFDEILMANEATCLLDSDVALEEIHMRYEVLFSLKHSGSLLLELVDVDANHDEQIPEHVHDVKFNQKTFGKSENKYKPNMQHTKKKPKSDESSDELDSDTSSIKTDSSVKNNKSKKRYYNSDNRRGVDRRHSGNSKRTRTPPPPYSSIVPASNNQAHNAHNSTPYSEFQRHLHKYQVNDSKPEATNKFVLKVSINENRPSVPGQQRPPYQHQGGINMLPPRFNRPPIPPAIPYPHPNPGFHPPAPPRYPPPYTPRYVQPSSPLNPRPNDQMQRPPWVPMQPNRPPMHPNRAPMHPNRAPKLPHHPPSKHEGTKHNESNNYKKKEPRDDKHSKSSEDRKKKEKGSSKNEKAHKYKNNQHQDGNKKSK